MSATTVPRLSSGAISHIYNTKDTSGKPVVQVVELKQINASSGTSANPRYRLAVSDGSHYQQAMLATQLNALVASGDIGVNTVLRLNDFIANEVANKRIIIILNVDVLGRAEARIGAPVSVDSIGTAKTEPSPDVNGSTATPIPAGAPPTAGGFKSGTGWSAPPASYNKPSATGVMSVAPGPSATSGVRFRPIQAINPYQTGWTVKGRCTYKSEVRRFQNARGDGQVISFELTDESGSIRITGFTEQAAHIDSTVHVGHVYVVSRAQLKQANERYNKSTSSFEMTLDRNSVLEEADDDGSVMQIRYNFTRIANLDSVEVKGLCDVVAVVHQVGELTEIIVRSTGEPLKKRPIVLVDNSNATVELTLWRTQAETLLTEADEARHPVIMLRNASRGDFGGVCLNTTRSTVIEVDPTNIEEANMLRGWYDAGGAAGTTLQSISGGTAANLGHVLGERKALEDARQEEISSGLGNGMVSFVMRGYITFMNKDKELSYPSDPDTKKKCVESGAPGIWRCESTGRDFTDDEIVHRYICNFRVMDYSGSQWMSAFDEAGQSILRRSAGEMRSLRESDRALFDSIIDDCFFRTIAMKVTVKEQEYQGERKIRYTISRCEYVDFVSESRALLSEISNYGIVP